MLKKRLFSLILALMLTAGTAVGVLSSFTASATDDGWVGTWSTSPVHSGVSVLAGSALTDYIPAGSTVRSVFTISIGGQRVRLRFSNKYGSVNLYIGEASVAKTDPNNESAIIFDTARQITFNGQTSVTIPAGEDVWSDPVKLQVNALDSLSVSTYYPTMTYTTTSGLCGAHTFMSTPLTPIGSQVTRETLTSEARVSITSNTITYNTIPFVVNCDVYTNDQTAYSAVIIGDSTLANDIPKMLAQKLVANGITNVGVLQQAIVGNRLLYPGAGLLGPLYGDPLIDRFEEDCLEQTGAKVVLIKIGLNDIMHPTAKSMAGKAKKVTDEEIIQGYIDMARRARAKGMKVYFFTKTPVKGYSRDFVFAKGDIEWRDEFHDRIETLDNWVMTTNEIDGWIDIYNVRDAYDLDRFVPSFTEDWVHPELLGQIAMTDDIPLSIFGYKGTAPITVATLYKTDPFAKLKAVAARGVPELTTAAPTTAEPETTAAPVPVDEPVTQPQSGYNVTPTPVLPITPALPATTATTVPFTQAAPPATQPGTTAVPGVIVTGADGVSYAVYSYVYVVNANGETATQTATAAILNGQVIATAPVVTNTYGEPAATLPMEEIIPSEPVDRTMSMGTKIGIAVGFVMVCGAVAYAIVLSKRKKDERVYG